MRQSGYTATVEVVGDAKRGKSLIQDVLVEDQEDGGSNALNINRLYDSSLLIENVCYTQCV